MKRYIPFSNYAHISSYILIALAICNSGSTFGWAIWRGWEGWEIWKKDDNEESYEEDEKDEQYEEDENNKDKDEDEKAGL